MSAAFHGVVTSLITPFLSSSDDEPDQPSEEPCEVDTFRVASLTRWQARAGVRAVAVAGWAGEGPTLRRCERVALIRAAGSAKGPMAILAHIGSPSTARSIEFALDAKAAGADGLVLVMPYYNKPSFAGICRHVEAVAEATPLPLLLEFDEAATRLALTPCQMAELTRVPNVVSLIDHSDNPLHVECMSRARRGVSFLTAHEPSAGAAGLLGADGLFSAVANVQPALVVALAEAIRARDVDGVREIGAQLSPLVALVEAEGVAALKACLHTIVGCETLVRAPLQPLGHAARQRVASIRVLIETMTPPAAGRLPMVAAR